MAIRNTYGVYQMKPDPVSAGVRAYAKWLRGKTTRYLLFMFVATYTCTVAVTRIQGLGSVVQCFTEFGIDEGGNAISIDPRLLLHASEALRSSASSAARVTSLGTQTTVLVEILKIPFELIWSSGAGVPFETRYRERDTGLDTSFFYTINGLNNGVGSLVTGGTATITNVNVYGQQYFDDDPESKTPLFKPGYKQIKVIVPGANTNFTVDLNLESVVRAITILQDTNVGMVNDVVTGMRLMGTNRDYIGRGAQVKYDLLTRGQEFNEGGGIWLPSAGGVTHLVLQEFGMLSNALNPYQDTNFQLEFNAAASITSGATSQTLIILLHTLQRDVFLRPDKRYVTAPDAEFAERAPGLIVQASA